MNESMRNEMKKSAKQGEFVLPLELQFSMRKAEVNAQEMTWEQLYSALLNLYYQRLMEWHAVKELMQQENIVLDFDIPSDIELQKLANEYTELNEIDCEDEDPFEPV
tara:strand:- start:212 stop:532 length:321 start_codon:yes stop_codon:yes gene_type:complete